MRRHLVVLLPLLLAAGPAAPDPAKLLAGRYYRQFPNGLVTGEKYVGEDIVEIVPIAPRAAYIKISLSYYNGHSCEIYGVGTAEQDALVYHDPRPHYLDEVCTLTVRRSRSSLSIEDGEGSCSSYCGARGSLHNVALPFSSKRPIRYMAKLKASGDFQDAVAEWQSGKPHR